MACPLVYYKRRIEEFKKHPRLVRAYIRAAKKYMETHPDSRIAEKYKDVWAYFFRNLYCDAEWKFERYDKSLFGRPDYKAFLEEQFGIDLTL